MQYQKQRPKKVMVNSIAHTLKTTCAPTQHKNGEHNYLDIPFTSIKIYRIVYCCCCLCKDIVVTYKQTHWIHKLNDLFSYCRKPCAYTLTEIFLQLLSAKIFWLNFNDRIIPKYQLKYCNIRTKYHFQHLHLLL